MRKQTSGAPYWILWVQTIKGFIFYPHAAIKGLLLESEVVWRERSDPENPFKWESVRFNLTGDLYYYPMIE